MTIAASQPGQKTSSIRSGRRSASVLDTIAKIAVVAPCRTAVPSPRTSHSISGGVGERAQVVDVLDDREAGADGEPLHGGVDEEADAAARNQEHDERRP